MNLELLDTISLITCSLEAESLLLSMLQEEDAQPILLEISTMDRVVARDFLLGHLRNDVKRLSDLLSRASGSL